MRAMTAPSLSRLQVHEAMHPGIISVDQETMLRVVARLMGEYRVHAVAITSGRPGRRPPGILSALDVVAAAAIDSEKTAGEVAATEVLTISSGDRLDHAAQLMAEHELSHLIVIDEITGRPAGVLSTLDVVAAYGG